MNRQLAATISSILACSAYSSVAAAQEQTVANSEAGPAQLETVIVTGSLIPQAQQDTSPVIAITAEDMASQGFQNVTDVLRAQPLATGAVQDNQFAGGFTPGATTISLLGLEPGFTLILLDGRPLADYPLLYNGQGNFTDLSSIPTGMVERIDILPGNQSAIYGSAAIAGVVNIILKKHLEGIQIAARAGGYDEGGGENMRFELTGGQSRENFDVTFGLQYSSQKPIWGTQRKRFDSNNDDPDAALHFGSRTFVAAHVVLVDPFPTVFEDPGAGDLRRALQTTSAARRPMIPARASATTAAASMRRATRPSSTNRKAGALTSMPTCSSATTPSSTPACFFRTTGSNPTAARLSGCRTSMEPLVTSGTTPVPSRY